MGATDLLVLRRADVDERFSSLSQRLVDDPGLRELYVRDPARVILKTVFPDNRIPAAEINRGNRVLYALLSNDDFMEWAQQYESDLLRRAQESSQEQDPEAALRGYMAAMDRGALHRDLVEAVAAHADPELIAALTWRPDIRNRISDAASEIGAARLPEMDVAVDIETFVYAVAVAAVFAVAVGVVFIGAQPDDVMSRLDVQTVARQLASRLRDHGQDLRQAGALTEFKARNAGYIR